MERVVVINWTVICVFILFLEVVSSASDGSSDGKYDAALLLCTKRITDLQKDSIKFYEHDSTQRNVILRHHEGSEDGESRESPLRFSQTLGRNKRNSGGDDFYENIQKDGLAAFIMDAIRDVPWADVHAANEGKRHVANFTPRLGRESGEELLNGLGPDESRWLQEPVLPEELLYQRSPPFAPRLGRHLSPFYPRLGRDHDKIPFS